MLTLFRPHLKNCKRAKKGRSYRSCACPLSFESTLRGESIRKSLDPGTGKRPPDWSGLEDRVYGRFARWRFAPATLYLFYRTAPKGGFDWKGISTPGS